MKRTFAPLFLMTRLLPTFAQGQSFDDLIGKGKGHLCETTGLGWPESVDCKDLIKRDDLYFKKFTDVPFTGETTGEKQGSFDKGRSFAGWTKLGTTLLTVLNQSVTVE